MPYAHETFEYIMKGLWEEVPETKCIVEFYILTEKNKSQRVEIVKVVYEDNGLEVEQRLFEFFYLDMVEQCWNVINSKIKELL